MNLIRKMLRKCETSKWGGVRGGSWNFEDLGDTSKNKRMLAVDMSCRNHLRNRSCFHVRESNTLSFQAFNHGICFRALSQFNVVSAAGGPKRVGARLYTSDFGARQCPMMGGRGVVAENLRISQIFAKFCGLGPYGYGRTYGRTNTHTHDFVWAPYTICPSGK